jgi:hypothetical protein
MNLQRPNTKLKTVPAIVVLAGLALVASFALLWTPVQAQDGSNPTAPQGSPITFSGTVESVGPRFIVVNGLMVDLQGAAGPLDSLQLGASVTIVGTLQNSVVQATVVQLDNDDRTSGAAQPVIATPVPPSSANTSANRSSGPRRIVIQGPVREISPTSLRIFDLNITIDTNSVVVPAVSVGDNVRVVGDFTTENNTFRIRAINITPINPTIRRGSSDDISGRDSFDSDRPAPVNPVPQTSDRQSDRSSNSVSDRESDRQAPPPPPPSRPDSSRDSISDRSSISAASARSS